MKLQKILAAAFLVPTLLLGGGVTNAYAEQDTPDLEQEVSADEQIGSGRVVIRDGHVDLGAMQLDGKLALLLRDDSAEKPVWRKPEDVVLLAPDAAQVPAPDKPEYAFIGAKPGEKIWVLPQTQQPGIVWPGWSTQHPTLADAVTRGVTMRLKSVNGPGKVSVFLQDGNFGQPRQLFASDGSAQEIWIDLGTHTHANWVFTQPGVYGLEFEYTGQNSAGETLSTSAVVQFAVGDTTDAQSAFGVAAGAPIGQQNQNATGGDASQNQKQQEQSPTAASADSAANNSTTLLIIGVAAVIIVIAAISFIVTSQKKRRVLAETTKDA